MKKLFFSLVLLSFVLLTEAQEQYALLVIDIQNFYFPGGRSELVEPLVAAQKAAEAIDHARAENKPVIYVQHKSAAGMEINNLVKPLQNEQVFVKEEVNSFLNTGLADHLKTLCVDTLVICGMQTHMCVEAAVRAAHDMGYAVILLHDACATRNLKFGDLEVSAADVHASTLAAMKSYANVISVEEWIGRQ